MTRPAAPVPSFGPGRRPLDGRRRRRSLAARLLDRALIAAWPFLAVFAVLGVAVGQSAALIGSARAATLPAAQSARRTFTGSFQKVTTVGTQDVNIGSAAVSAMNAGPYFGIFWMGGSDAASNTWDDHNNVSVGYVAKDAAGVITQYVVQSNMDGNRDTTAVATETTRRIAAAAISINHVETVRAEATFSGTQGTSDMRLTWATNTSTTPWGTPWVHYFIVTGVTHAKVVTKTFSSTGPLSITGAGFTPQLALFASTYAPTGIPGMGVNSYISVGCANNAGEQWGNGFFSYDAQAAAATNRWQLTTSLIAVPQAGDVEGWRASYVGMTADGIDVNVGTAVATTEIVALFVRGIQTKVGAFTKTGPGVQTVTAGHTFTPRGLLLTSYGEASTSLVLANARWGFGATDGTNHAAAAIGDQDAVTVTRCRNIWRNDATITIGESATPNTYDTGVATIAGTNTFSVNWVEHTTSAQYLYLIIG